MDWLEHTKVVLDVLHSFTFAFNSILKIVVQPYNGIFQIILYLKTSAVLLMILF